MSIIKTSISNADNSELVIFNFEKTNDMMASSCDVNDEIIFGIFDTNGCSCSDGKTVTFKTDKAVFLNFETLDGLENFIKELNRHKELKFINKSLKERKFDITEYTKKTDEETPSSTPGEEKPKKPNNKRKFFFSEE